MLLFKSKRIRWFATLALCLAPFTWCTPVHAEASEVFSYPSELESDVRFWIRVYTEVTTEQGLIHDDWYLGLVYEVLRFDPADSQRQRERSVEQAKARYAQLLRRFAARPDDRSELRRITAVELADAILRKPRPLPDGLRTRLVLDEAQGEVEAQPVAAVAIV